jgi:hypothetical protein
MVSLSRSAEPLSLDGRSRSPPPWSSVVARLCNLNPYAEPFVLGQAAPSLRLLCRVQLDVSLLDSLEDGELVTLTSATFLPPSLL